MNPDRYKIRCIDWNDQHVKFNVFDTKGANCGVLTIETKDVTNFVTQAWNGAIFWDGKVPFIFDYAKESTDTKV